MSDRAPAESFWSVVRADLRRAAEVEGLSGARLVSAFALPGVWAVFLFRIASWARTHHLKPISRLVYLTNMTVFGCELMPGATVGPGLAVPHPVGSGFVEYATLGRNVTMLRGVRLGAGAFEDRSLDGAPTVGDNCWFLDGAKANGPVTIGADTVIAYNAWVVRDLPAGVVASGVPAKVVAQRSEPPLPGPAEAARAIAGG